MKPEPNQTRQPLRMAPNQAIAEVTVSPFPSFAAIQSSSHLQPQIATLRGNLKQNLPTSSTRSYTPAFARKNPKVAISNGNLTRVSKPISPEGQKATQNRGPLTLLWPPDSIPQHSEFSALLLR